MNSKPAQGTSGQFKVTLHRDASQRDFEGDLDKMALYRGRDQMLNLSATQTLRDEPAHLLGVDISLPAEIPTDGTTHTYRFVPFDGLEFSGKLEASQATLMFSEFDYPGGIAYSATKGEIEASFDGEHLKATFHATAAYGSKTMELQGGDVGLTGLLNVHSTKQEARGTLKATFSGEGAPIENFDAREFRIVVSDYQGHRPDHRIFVGDHYDENDGANIRNVIGIVIQRDAQGFVFDLGATEKARVQYQRLSQQYGGVTAHAGKLTLNGPVTNDHASGTFCATFSRNNGPEFTAEGSFDIHRVPSP